MTERTPASQIPEQRRDLSGLRVPRALYTETHPTALHFASALHAWQTATHDITERTPERIANRAYIEVGELDEAIKAGGNEEAILGEAIDAVIGFFGVALTVAEPKRAAEALFDKLVLMANKYPPAEVARLKREGLNTEGALDELRRQWKGGTVQHLFPE